MADTKEDIKNYALKELTTCLKKKNLVRYRARQVFNWIYARRLENFDLMTDLSREDREALRRYFYFSKLKILKQEISSDKTEKFLMQLSDGANVESVLIPEGERLTLCISSQVGCKYACKFCMSGKQGFKRNLSASEIVNQYLTVVDLRKDKITNIVFMGIGEPLDNFQNVIRAIEIFIEPAGLGFGKRRICISTCGIAPEIEKLGELKLGIKLSVSLHSADDKIRSEIMPINRKYPLRKLKEAIKSFNRYEKYPVTFEYALLENLNIGREDAKGVAKFLEGMNCKLNLIPYNESSLKFNRPSSTKIEKFCEELSKRGVFYTLRKSRGLDIHAACGQLRANFA